MPANANDFFNNLYNNPMFHAGLGLLSQPRNIGQGLLSGMGSYQNYQAGQQQQELMKLRLAQIEDAKRQQEAQRQQEAARAAAQERVLSSMAPEPTVPLRRGGEAGGMLDIAQGYPDVGAAMVRGRFAPQTGSVPSAIAEWNAYNAMSPEDQKRFLEMKRGQQWKDIGGGLVQPSTGQFIQKTLAPQQELPYLGKAEEAKVTARKAGERKAAAVSDLPQIESEAEYITGLLESLKTHPGLGYAVGKSSMLPIIPGTDAADFMTRLDQIRGKQFLQAYQTLKGGGQITEVEGKKAEQALARLNVATKEEDFKGAIDEFIGIIQKGAKRARFEAGESPKGANKMNIGRFTVEAM